jgi:hypothetical protein
MPLQTAWINVEDTSRDVLDVGPVTNFTYFRIRRRMNRAGEFRMVVPATDPRIVDTMAVERTVQAYAIVNNTPTWQGGGVITKQRWRKSGDGSPVLEVSGPDLLGELTRSTVGELKLDDADGDNNLDDLLDKMPAYWSSNKTGTTGDFAAQFSHETPLNSLIQVAEKLDVVFRNEADGADIRNIEWYNTLPSTSVVTLVSAGELRDLDDNPYVAVITDIQESEDSSQIVNRAYFYGSGNGDARFSSSQIDDSVHVWPDDSSTLDSGNYSGSYTTSFDWDDTEKCIDEDNSIATYGVRSAAVSFPELAPITNTDTNFDQAMNTLIKSTVHWLERRCEPTKTYTVQCAGLQQTVLPGDIVTVDARFYRDGEAPILINNEDFTALEVETLIDDDGVRVSSIMLAERRKYPVGEGDIVASNYATGQVTRNLPQIGQYTNTTTYREPMDDDNYATLYFWLAEEVSAVDRALLRFKVRPFDSMAGSYSGGDSNTMYTYTASTGLTIQDGTADIGSPSEATTGGSSQPTTGSDGVHNHSLDIPAGTISTVPDKLVGFDSANDLVNNDSSAHSDDTVIQDDGSHSHTITHTHEHDHTHTDAGHTHATSETAHRHTMQWGYVKEDGADTYAATDLEFSINGGAYSSGSVAAISGATGWYEYDVTASIRNTPTKTPSATAGYNYITCRIKSGSQSGKSCQIEAQIAATVLAQPLASY